VGLLALARGDLSRASASLADCVERGMAAGMARSVAVSSAGLARLALGGGDPAAACAAARRGVDAVTAGGEWIWAAELVPTAVEALLAASSVGEAHELATAFAAGVRGRDSPLAEVARSQCRALLAEATGHLDEAAEAYAEAEHLFSALPRPHEAAMVGAHRGRCLLAGGHPEGVDALVRAHACLRGLGASADAEAVAQDLRAHGAPVAAPGQRHGRSDKGAPLSAREEEVADLAARGLTNTEIATALHLSPRTVEAHVAKAVRKLGLGSKRALIGARDRLGDAHNA
jgi:DNA-binding CsgD family transcriptional regulator